MGELIFYPVTSESGNVVEAARDEEAETVLVRFKGNSLYEYGVDDDPIPAAVWNDWQATFDDKDSSTGTLFHQTIKKYAFRRIE